MFRPILAAALTTVVGAMLTFQVATAAPLSVITFSTTNGTHVTSPNANNWWTTIPASTDDPNYQWPVQLLGNSWVIDEAYNTHGNEIAEPNLQIRVNGVRPLDTGIFNILDADGTTISDQIIVDASGGGTRIRFAEGPVTDDTANAGVTLCTESNASGATCHLDIRLKDAGGADLAITLYSDGDPTAAGVLSDMITIQIPEPASVAVLAAGLTGLGYLRRRRRG